MFIECSLFMIIIACASRDLCFLLIFLLLDPQDDLSDQWGCLRGEGLTMLSGVLDVFPRTCVIIRNRGPQCVQNLTQLEVVHIVTITPRSSLGTIIQTAFGIVSVIDGYFPME